MHRKNPTIAGAVISGVETENAVLWGHKTVITWLVLPEKKKASAKAVPTVEITPVSAGVPKRLCERLVFDMDDMEYKHIKKGKDDDDETSIQQSVAPRL